MKRRTLIQAMGAAGAVATLPLSSNLFAGAGKPGKVLFMGGTGFIGPHMVRALVAAGHEVVLFNRGKSNPHLFPDLRKIKGDRVTDDIQQLAGEHWDYIVDSSCYIPRAVDMLMDAVDTDKVRSSTSSFRPFRCTRALPTRACTRVPTWRGWMRSRIRKTCPSITAR